MRHGDKINNLGRTNSHRQALLSNLASQLIQHKRIKTTLAKAKSLRQYVEPLITKSKDNSMHSRRVVFSYLQNKYAITELFSVVADKVGNRPGGYTRIFKLGSRPGDGAEMAFIELVDFNEFLLVDRKSKPGTETAKKTRRSRTKKTTATNDAAAATAVQHPVVQEEPPKDMTED